MYPYFIKYIYLRSNYRDYWDIFSKYYFEQCLLDKFKILNWRFFNCRLCNTCVTQYEKQNNVLVTCVDPQRPQKIDTLSGLLFHSSKNIYGCFLRDLLPFPHSSPKSWSHHGSRQVLVPRRLRWLWDQDCQENSHNQQPLSLHFFHCPFTFSSVFWLVNSYLGLMFPHHSEDLWWLNPPSYILILLVQKQNVRYSKWQWRNVLCHVYNRNIHWSVNF